MRKTIQSSNNNCPSCESIQISGSYKVADHEYNINRLSTYYECKNCKVIYQYPMPGLDELSSFYPAEYHSMSPNTLIYKLKYRLRLAGLKKLIHSEGAILDFGCGDGSFLKYCSEKLPGIIFYGYEINDKNELIKLKDNVIICKGEIDFLLNNISLCQIISMNHVIEHLPEVKKNLQQLFEKLEPNGIIEGQTPNTASLEKFIFRRRWSGFHAPRHTVIFSKKGMKILFESLQLHKIEIKGAFNPAGIAVSLASLFNPETGGIIQRNSFKWLFFIAMATLLYPIDLLSKPGIINFTAYKK